MKELEVDVVRFKKESKTEAAERLEQQILLLKVKAILPVQFKHHHFYSTPFRFTLN